MGQSEPAELQAQVSWWGRAGGAVAVAHRTQKCLPGRAYISPNTGGPALAAGACESPGTLSALCMPSRSLCAGHVAPARGQGPSTLWACLKTGLP